MVSIISTKYADALYKIAIERELLDEYKNEVIQLVAIFEKEKELMQVLLHPEVPINCKVEIIKDLFDNKISKEIVALMMIMIQKNRQTYIVDVFREFIEKVEKYYHIGNAVITVGDVVSEEYIKRIQDVVENKIGRKIKITTKQDERIIAGFKIKIDDIVIDRSVENKIKNIEKAIS